MRGRNEAGCGDSSRVVVVEVIVEPVVVPVPLITVPDEVADNEVAVGVAVTCSVPSLPPPFEYSQG